MSDRGAWSETISWAECGAAQRAAAVAAARRAFALPAYRAEWSHAGISAGDVTQDNWTRLPVLSKDALVEAGLREPPFGGRLGVPREALAHVFVAPGPLYMPYTARDLDHVAGSFAKALTACGIARGDLVDQTTMYNWVIAATVLDRALGMIGAAVVPGGVGQSERHMEVIRNLKVDAIVAFPTFLEHLLDAAANGDKLPLRKAAVMGELRHADAKARLQNAHGISVREFYGIADVGAIAWECEAGDGMHLRDDLLVEFLNPGDSEAVEPLSGRPAELVVTDFHREAMPIIRLRTGDLVDEIVAGPCRCGRTAPRIRRIVGRASEITKVKGMFVVPRQVADVMQRNGIERPFRLIVDRIDGGRDQLTLAIAGGALRESAALKTEVEKTLGMRIELAFVESLPEGGPRLEDRRMLSPA